MYIIQVKDILTIPRNCRSISIKIADILGQATGQHDMEINSDQTKYNHSVSVLPYDEARSRDFNEILMTSPKISMNYCSIDTKSKCGS